MDLEITEYFDSRKKLFKSKDLPKLSNARLMLGEQLSSVVFEQCDEALKPYFGLDIPLKGAGDELWVSPSDLLIGKVCLKPPLTSKRIQALTHKGILDIGIKIEKKYWNEMELEKEKALADQKISIEENFDVSLKQMLKEFELHERAECEKKIEELTEEFEKTLVEELYALETKIRTESKAKNRKHKESLHKKYTGKLNVEIDTTVKQLTKQFLRDLEKQESILKAEYFNKLQKAEIRKEYAIELERSRGQEALKQLRQNLECRNIANMMYVLCMERQKCKIEKRELEKKLKKEMYELQKENQTKACQLEKLKKDADEITKQLIIRQTCLTDIISQFQKFINFAMKAAPTQAEFLLSLEEMMLYELAHSLTKADNTKFTTHEKTIPWQYSDESSTISSQNLEINDYHDCFNEMPQPKHESEKSPEFLPAFTYKENLYVREDFRNMLSQGLEIKPSNELWNEDVEVLMKTLKQPVFEKNLLDEKKASKSSVKFNGPKSEINNAPEQQLPEYKSIPSFIYPNNKRLLKNIELGPIDFSSINREEKKRSILGSRNSLELIRQNVPYHKKDDNIEQVENIIQPSERQNSVMLQLSGKKKASAAEKRSDSITYQTPTKRLTKLVMAKDSVILSKASLSRKSEKFKADIKDSVELVMEKSEQRQSKLFTARDSIDLIRQSRTKFTREFEVPEGPRKKSASGFVTSSKTSATRDLLQSLEDTREVSITDINLDAAVYFDQKPVVYDTYVEPDSLTKVYEQTKQKTLTGKKKKSRDNFLKKQNRLKVVGDVGATEHLQEIDTFTTHRIHSFIHLIKDHPNLIRMFTACSR